jgi:uncharacterized protein (DUF2141 family)
VIPVRTSPIAALAALSALAATPAVAETCEGRPTANRLTVQVSGLRDAAGEIAVTVYPDDQKRFLAPKGKLARVRTQAATPVTSACFFLPAPGAYAVAVYHDANADRDFNRTIVGLPAEGFGFSNDPSTRVGLPAFKAVRFQAGPGEHVIKVRLRYLR